MSEAYFKIKIDLLRRRSTTSNFDKNDKIATALPPLLFSYYLSLEHAIRGQSDMYERGEIALQIRLKTTTNGKSYTMSLKSQRETSNL